MSKWFPSKGDLFYVTGVLKEYVMLNNTGSPVNVKSRDESKRTMVFIAKAKDETMMVAEQIYGGYLENITLRLSDWDFSPVGPDVAAALCLQSRIKE